MIKKYLILMFLFFLPCIPFSVNSGTVPKNKCQIKQVRIWPSPESTRVVFDLSAAIQYEMNPNQDAAIVRIKMHNADFHAAIASLNLEKTRIKKINTRKLNANDLELELELIHALSPKIFTLPPNPPYGHRLVLDLEMHQNEKDAILAMFEADAFVESPEPVKEVSADTLSHSKHNFVIAIDPGHGGEDPGAIGKYGTREKDVVLAIAKYLKELIDKEPHMRAVLIRKGDYYVALQNRVKKAREHKADLFVSIHADAFHDKQAQGASVFTLSERGASSAAARWLAERENRSDLMGGVKLYNKDKALASVLLDLTQTKSKEEGHKAAQYILNSLGQMSYLHKKEVEHAGFAVLKAPDIPSLLVETEFISNLRGESKLKTRAHQKKIASAIFAGIKQYVHKHHKHH